MLGRREECRRGQSFRPVVLTSLTTIAGMLPILLETSRQAQVVVPMAVSLSFGLMLATILALVLAPVLYSIIAVIGPAVPVDEVDVAQAS